MADALTFSLSFPPDNAAELTPKEYDKAITSFEKELTKASSSVWTKPVDKQNILDLLNPAVNSLPFLHALVAQAASSGKDKTTTEDLLDRAIVFVSMFDAVQVRYAGDQWGHLLKWMFDVLDRLGSRDLTPLSTAMLRLDPTAGTFTTWHLRFIRLSYAAGVPSQALPILDKNIYAFPQAPNKDAPEELLSDEIELSNTFITPKSGFTSPLRVEYILEYYLLGAHVYIGLRNYNRARIFLEFTILTPAQSHACSALQVEAYKKWIMIGLLAEGKSFPLPRTHDASVMKSIRSIAKPYDELADNFEKRNWPKYQAEMEHGAQIWHEDGNLRLVKEAGDALLRYRVSDLQKTYAALPMGRVASYIGFTPDATLQMLTDMIRSHALNASITPSGSGSSSDAVLRFHRVTPTSGDVWVDALEAQTKRIEDLVTFVRDADRRLQLTKEYVEHMKRNKRSGGADADLADHMDLTWDAPAASTLGEDGDEDIMA